MSQVRVLEGAPHDIDYLDLLTLGRVLKQEDFLSDRKHSIPLNIHIPSSAQQYGFVTTPGGTHTSRTMMFPELEMLLAACPPTASFADYEAAILEENILLKNTVSTRQRTLRGLRELYALDRSVLLFRAMLDLWDARGESHSLLALLCALTRDSLLRATIPVILTTAKGDEANSAITSQAITAAYPDRYNEATLGKIGRNTAASWTQSGHLVGRATKRRDQVTPYPENVAYALLLGHLCGQRGEALFQSPWTQLLDLSGPDLHNLAQMASTLGYLEYRRIGNVIEVSFSYLLRQEGTA